MRFLFDTNICIELIRARRAPIILAHMDLYPPDSFAISTITLSELQVGIAKSMDHIANSTLLARFLGGFMVMSYDAQAAAIYGPVRAALELVGNGIGPLDTLIAAHAISLNLTLITNNEREFRRIPNLKVENWIRP